MVKKIALLTVIIELITVFFRFALKMKSSEATKAVAGLTFGLRIHHGYIGLLIMIASAFLSEKYKKYAFIAGTAMFLSDLIHHFIVLKLITGSPEFDIFY
jgi:hypothetical protein